jgi:anhydro-N-acetylmuramic acid kinase
MMKNSFSVIGLMSGTSLDGVDICAINFNLDNNQWSFNINKAETFKYPDKLINLLKNSILLESELLLKLDINLGKFYGQLIDGFIKKYQLNIDFIGSHGHTVFHQPENGFTLQIGSGQEIANLTALPVYCDFRSKDVSLGGQGAPLVPIGDQLLFNEFDVCFNFGGIANVSYVKNKVRIAYDVCPFNMPLNLLANELHLDYDKNGDIAKSGELDVELLEQLNQLNYYKELPPKSLGLESFNSAFNPLIRQSKLSIKDKLHTISVHISQQITRLINSLDAQTILLTGGGCYNTFIIDMIKQHSTKKIVIPSKEIIDYKEALIFGFLGVLKHQNKINVLESVTGATKDSCSGTLFSP